MNGFFILAEISGLQQLLNIEGSAGTELIKNCERSINNTMRAQLNIHGSFLVFQIESGIENSAAVIESAVNLLEIISSYNEDIHEYSMMLLYRRRTDDFKLVAEIKQTYFSICEDFAILVDNKIFTEAGRTLTEDYVNGFQLIKPDEVGDIGVGSEYLEKLIDHSETEKILEIIVPDIESESVPEKIVIQGVSELSVRLNISRAVAVVSEKNPKYSPVYIEFLDNETEIIMPFFRSLDGGLIPLVEDYLEGVELNTWNDGKYKLEQINSDYPEEYFFSIYCLYLKGVLKLQEQAMLPQMIVVCGISKYSEKYINYISRIIEYLKDNCSPIMFFIDSAESDMRYDFSSDVFFNNALRYECCNTIELPDVSKKLNYQQTRLLFILKFTEGILERRVLDIFLTGFGYNNGEIVSGIKSLADVGCIIDGRYIRVVRTDKIKNIHNEIKDEIEIYRAFSQFITENIHQNLLADFGLAAIQLIEAADDDSVTAAIYACLTRMLNLGRTDFVKNYLDECSILKKEISSSLRLRALLIENNKSECLKMLKMLPENLESPENLDTALLQFETSRYFHAMNDHQRALNYVKKVLIFLQAGDYPELEGAAFIELGFLMLCKGKLLESSEYMNLALEKLSGSGDLFNLMKAHIFSGLQQYLWGALDSALDSAAKALEIAGANGYEEWRFFIDFFVCRMFFELGRYYDAEKRLSECLLRSEIFRDEQRRKIFSAWTARACIYQGKIYRGINMLLSLDEDPEVLFFLSEAYYLNGNMEKAVDSIERAGSSDAYFELGFMSLENISWKNGFNSVEGRVLRSEKGTGVLLHNIRAFYAFLLGMTGNREYGIEILFSLTRDEKISENDPYNRLYFHFYCQLLERRQNADVVDKLTLMSKALKYLQQTASRIQSPAVRQQFMMKNYWNSQLVAEARKEKLI